MILQRTNVTVYQMQGKNVTAVSNITTNAPLFKVYQYPVPNNGTALYITALPFNQTNYSTAFSFAYSLVSAAYPLDGGSWLENQLATASQEQIEAVYNTHKGFYIVIAIASAIFPIALAAGIYTIRTWPFDLPSDFERRRMRMARDLKKILDSFKQSSYYQKSEASKSITPQKEHRYTEEEQPTERSERVHRVGPPSQPTENRYQTEDDKYLYSTGRNLLKREIKRQDTRETEEKMIKPNFKK